MQKLLSLAAALVALTLADTAHAVLTPALPGWSVRVVASGFPTLAPDAFAVDPVSGDLFAIAVGGDPPTLIRVHSNGTVTTLASLASVGRGIAFDAVARILYVHGHTIIYRYSESGSLLGTLPISNTTASFALGPDRRLYSIEEASGEGTLPLHELHVSVFDEAAGDWQAWRTFALDFDLFVPNLAEGCLYRNATEAQSGACIW